MRIGIDFGGVLTATTTPPEHGDPLEVQPQPDSQRVIEKWRDKGYGTILISKAGDVEKERKARFWLAHYRFTELFTEIEFCRERQGKITLCEQHGIDVMVDDTTVQLEMLRTVPHRILFGSIEAPEGMIPALDWQATESVVSAL